MIADYFNRRGFIQKAGLAAIGLAIIRVLPFNLAGEKNKKVKIEANPSAVKRNKSGK